MSEKKAIGRQILLRSFGSTASTAASEASTIDHKPDRGIVPWVLEKVSVSESVLGCHKSGYGDVRP